MNINKNDTAVLVTDPQNDVLSEQGVAWGLVGDSVTENKTVENLERLFKAARVNGYDVFISPHYYYPTDQAWKFSGPIEHMMHESKMFTRSGALRLTVSPGRAPTGLSATSPSSTTARPSW